MCLESLSFTSSLADATLYFIAGAIHILCIWALEEEGLSVAFAHDTPTDAAADAATDAATDASIGCFDELVSLTATFCFLVLRVQSLK